jgi:hypothetical protein
MTSVLLSVEKARTHDWEYITEYLTPAGEEKFFFDQYSFYRCRVCGLESVSNPEAGIHFVLQTCNEKVMEDALS